MTEQHVPWTHITGALAWAPMPAISNTEIENDRHNNNNNSNNPVVPSDTSSRSSPTTSLLLWPVILYPSWSTAARSPLFDDCDGDILLMGCQKPVSKENLCSNRVPSRVALGKGANGSKFRLKVVAHYLGFSSPSSPTGAQQLSSQPWGSVSVDSLQQYTLENCETYIQIWERNGKDVQWNSLLNAMKEAAALMEQNAFDPMKLCKNLGIDPNYKNFSSRIHTNKRMLQRRIRTPSTSVVHLKTFRIGIIKVIVRRKQQNLVSH
jgi:hypothetical protein